MIFKRILLHFFKQLPYGHCNSFSIRDTFIKFNMQIKHPVDNLRLKVHRSKSKNNAFIQFQSQSLSLSLSLVRVTQAYTSLRSGFKTLLSLRLSTVGDPIQSTQSLLLLKTLKPNVSFLSFISRRTHLTNKKTLL